MKNSNEKEISILAHILGLITGFIGPLIMIFTTENKDVKNHAKNALNWQISLIIYTFPLIILFISIFFIGIIGILFLFLYILSLFTLDVIFSIIAAIKASKNELWRYPLAINFLK